MIRDRDALIGIIAGQRATLLERALEDAIHWCPHPAASVGRAQRSDQYWYELLPATKHLSEDDVREFFIIYKLWRWTKWNLSSLVTAIEQLRTQIIGSASGAISALGTQLQKCQAEGSSPKQHTSAASKVAFYTHPNITFYIWDQYALRSARFGDWVRSGSDSVPSSFYAAYADRHGRHAYSGFKASCTTRLTAERTKPDFGLTADAFRRYLKSTGGPLGEAPADPGGFVERRFLDKLMYQEGRVLEDLEKSAST